MCPLSGVPNSTTDAALVTVIPSLPQVSTLLEVMVGSDWVSATSPLTLYSGQTVKLRLTVNNVGKENVGELNVECLVGEGAGPPPQVQVDTVALASLLPLPPGSSLTVGVELTGVADTGGGAVTLRPEDSVSVTSDSRWSLSLPSSVKSLTTTGHPSLVSMASQGSGGRSGTPTGVQTSTQQVTVKVQYSGVGEDLTWCRKVTQQVSLVQMPSLVVSRWDVLPGDTQHNCFLVLDLVNKTNMEMELTYTERKTLLIEAGDMCRVPVPVNKCSFSESLDWVGGQGVADYLAECVNLSWSVVTQEGGEEVTRYDRFRG